MLAATLAAQVLLAACCLWLWLRLRAAAARLENHLGIAGASSVVLQNLHDRLQGHLDGTLAAQADGGGLASLPVAHREPHDAYRTVDELLAHMAGLNDQDQISQQEKLIKAVYQLQDALRLPDATLRACLQPIVEQLRQSTVMGRPVGNVELVQRGARVDTRTMWLLTRGTRVQQPLGVVVRDPQGQIINKAKVLCI
jgi:hypothetical protein